MSSEVCKINADNCSLTVIVTPYFDYVDVTIATVKNGKVLPVFFYKALEDPQSFYLPSFLRRLGSSIQRGGVEFPAALGDQQQIEYYANLLHNIKGYSDLESIDVLNESQEHNREELDRITSYKTIE